MSTDSGTSLPEGGDQQVLDVDVRHSALQAEQEGTQKKTFTNWINSQLSKHPLSSSVTDLFTDIQDGHVILDLLEVLSGEELPREKGRNVFQSRSNVASALTFLERRSIKLINIHVEDIVSGKPSIVLGLIWKIILHFHIEGLAKILADAEEKTEANKGASPTASPPSKKSARSRWQLTAKKALLQWAKETCGQYGSIDIKDFKSSWKTGLAFLAIIHSLRPDLVDMDKIHERTDNENLREAFRIAESELEIPRLLEPEDLSVSDPDEKSIMTYVAQFLQYSKTAGEPKKDMPVREKKAVEWLNAEDQALKELFAATKVETYAKKYNEILLFMRKFNEQKRIFLSDLVMTSLPVEDQALIRQSLENITTQIAEWKEDLDRSLPPLLNDIEMWLMGTERLQTQELPESENPYETMSLLRKISASYKEMTSPAAEYLETVKSFKNLDENGAILVPSDKIEEMKTRVIKILEGSFIALVDYRCAGHHMLGLLKEAKPSLKIWTGKYKSRESVEALLADWKDFMEEKQILIQLETAFQRFRELNARLMASDEYSNHSEIIKEYEAIRSKYERFLKAAQDAKSNLENVLSSWTHFENNIALITCWLDEQQRIQNVKVPMEIMAKWKSVHASSNNDGNFLIERTDEKTASKLSGTLKTVNSRWTKYVKVYEEQKKVENGSKTPTNPPEEGELESPASVPRSSEAEIKDRFESSKSKLEWYITAATLLLGQRLAPEEFISQYEKTAGSYGNENLDGFLKSADQMKNISSPNEKAAVDSVSADIRIRWQAVRDEIESYVFQLKILVEKKRFDELVCELEEQIRKEEKSADPRGEEELIRDHRVLFSEEGCQGRLNRCLQAMKELVDAPRTSSDNADADALISECARKLEALERRASEVLSSLLTRQGQTKEKNVPFTAYENGAAGDKSEQMFEVDPEHRNGSLICENNQTNGSTLDRMLRRYDAEKSNLENLLKSAREKFITESPRDAEDIRDLQSRLHELQELQAEAKLRWVKFESSSRTLEDLVDGTEKKKLSEKRKIFRTDLETLKEEIASRVQSLGSTIDILLPIEEVVTLLCESNQKPKKQEMEKFTLSAMKSVFQELKDFQYCVEDNIQQCDQLESLNEVVDPSSPVDYQSVQSVVHQYKTQLEATSETLMERENILKALEVFLSSLQTTKLAIEAAAALQGMDDTTLHERQRRLEALDKEVYRLRQEALNLDVSLQAAEISLEDPEVGGETSCEKLLSGFTKNIEKARQKAAQELSDLERREDVSSESLNTPLDPPMQKETVSSDEAEQKTEGQETEKFTLLEMGSVIQEIKDVRSAYEDEIHKVDGPGSSAEIDEDLSVVQQYKIELKANHETMRERENALKALKTFLSSLEALRSSVEAEAVVPGMERRTVLEKQKKLETLEKEVYSLREEAEKLDVSLQTSEILLEDPETATETSCQELIGRFSGRLEKAHEATLQELRTLDRREKVSALTARLNKFCKHMQHLQDKTEKLGLKDPTIPSIRQRMKSLAKLEKDLDSYSREKDSIVDGAAELLVSTQREDFEGVERCEVLWEDTRQCIIYSKEECEKALELLRRFQRCRTALTSLIQKGEDTISQRSSYMGKENLQKTIAKVEAVKQEFNDQVEDVEEVNSICKNLQFHLNKMKSFESPPFQKEANAMVDKWLDICEKIDIYGENLKNAFHLWNKILTASEDIGQWCELKLQSCEGSDLTIKDASSLQNELETQMQNLEEISKKAEEIQKILQSNELPLELQVIKTSLLNKIDMIRVFVARIPARAAAGSRLGADADSRATHAEQNGVAAISASRPDDLTGVNGIKVETPEDDFSINHLTQDETAGMEVQHERLQKINPEHPTIPPPGSQRGEEQTKDQLDELAEYFEHHQRRLMELRNRQEILKANQQPGLRGRQNQLEGLKKLAQETQEVVDSLEELKPTDVVSGGDRWSEMTLPYALFLNQLQDTMQILERHRLYESLSAALNSKMTSFSEKLLNFTGLSRGAAESERKSHKLQELREDLENLEKSIAEISEVKQESPAPETSGVEEALGAYRDQIRGFAEELRRLKEETEPSPEKRRIKKAKKTKKMAPEPEGHPVREEIVTDKKASKGRKKKKLIAEPCVEEKKGTDIQPATESIEPSYREQATDQKASTLSEVPGADRTPDNIQNLQEWVKDSRTRLETFKNAPCDEHELLEKIKNIQGLYAETAQKKIDLDVTAGERETVGQEPLERTTQREEAIGQLETLLGDCDGYGRQLEMSLNDLAFCDREFHRVSRLLSAVEGKVCDSETLLDSVAKADILKEVQISLSSPEDIETKGKGEQEAQTSSTENNDCQEEASSPDEVQEFQLVEDPKVSVKEIPPSSTGSLEKEENNSSEEPEPHLLLYQKDLEDIFARMADGGLRDLKSVQQTSAVRNLLHVLHGLKHVVQDVKRLPGEDQGGSVMEVVERKVNHLKRFPLELDEREAERQLQEIENLYGEISRLESTTSCANGGTLGLQKEDQAAGDSETTQRFRGRSLLCELDALKTQKRSERQEIKGYQTALKLAKSSLKKLLKEKEGLKTSPTENHTDCLEKIENFMKKIAKAKDDLHALKEKRSKLGCYGTTFTEKEKMDIDVKLLESYWEQMELEVEMKLNRHAKEAEELRLLKKKADGVRRMIQTQQDLLEQPAVPSEDALKVSLLLTADLQALRHSLGSLRNACELQTRRTWGSAERRSLEKSLEDLERELENLQHRVTDRQQTESQTPEVFLEQYSFLKPLYEVLLWLKTSHGRLEFEESVALLPEDLEKQIAECKKAQKEISDRKSLVCSNIEESKRNFSGVGSPVSEDFSYFSQQLQKVHEERIAQSAARLQELETGMEERKALFSEIKKIEELLRNLEAKATPVKRRIVTVAELSQQLSCLKSKIMDLEEIEGLVLTLLKNSQTCRRGLKISEQLYLNDTLRSLKIKASSLRRLEERKFLYLEKVLGVYNEFQERTNLLNQELKRLRLGDPEVPSVEEDLKDNIEVAQNDISLPTDYWSQIHSYKELFEDAGLYWDSLIVDSLQKNSIVKHPEKEGQDTLFHSEPRRYQEMVGKIKATVPEILGEASSISSRFDIVDARFLCKKINKVTAMIREAMEFSHKHRPSGLDAEEPTVNEAAETLHKVHDSLSRLISDWRSRKRNGENTKRRLTRALSDLRDIHAELQEPFVVELDVDKIQEKLLRLEAIDEVSKSEIQDLRSIPGLDTANDLKEELAALNDVEERLQSRLLQHIDTANECCKALQSFEDAVAKLAELFAQFECRLRSHVVDLASLRGGSEHEGSLVSKKEEMDGAISEIRRLSDLLRSHCRPEAVEQIDDTLAEILEIHCRLTELHEIKASELSSYQGKYQIYVGIKQNIIDTLQEVETFLIDSFSQRPRSYKAAWMDWEKIKNLIEKLSPLDEELMKLRQISWELRQVSSENTYLLLDRTAGLLRDKWVYWLGVARNWETFYEDLKQEWKLISEEMEREMILLDHFQEEAPDKADVKQSTKHLLGSLLEQKNFDEKLKMQQLHLTLLMCRIENVCPASESSSGADPIPIIKEIQSMKQKCKLLQEKVHKSEDAVNKELRERDKLRGEFSAVKTSLHKVSTALEDPETQDPAETRAELEKIQGLIGLEKEKADRVAEKLAVRYPESVPQELSVLQEECRALLGETEEKVKNEMLKTSPQYVMTKTVEEITSGLQRIEVQLTQKSQNIFKAKELQKDIWDELDSCHSKLIALESEVQDLAEEDPSHAQEWMDKLTEPFSRYQQVSYLVERRTANLNKAASRLEEYEETFTSTKAWIKNADNLLNEEMKDCSAKALSRHLNALEIALDDSEQKHNILGQIHGELGELAQIFQTEEVEKRLGEISSQVIVLQQRIVTVLPHVQHVTSEILFIEAEVKRVEKKVETIKTILMSNDIDDMSPMEHYKNGEVILQNTEPMKKTIAEIDAYGLELRLSESGVRSLCVFRRTGQLFKQIETLENATKEQNNLLTPIIAEMKEYEQEQEKLKHLSKNFTLETPDIKMKTEALKERLEEINHRKEFVLLSLRRSITEQLQLLERETRDGGSDPVSSPVTEEPTPPGPDTPHAQTWMESYFLPSLVEEAEEDSLLTPFSENATVEDKALAAGDVSQRSRAEPVPDPSTAPSEEADKGDAGETSAAVMSEAEAIFSDCQGQVAEVELWLERVNSSLASGKQDPEMQRVVERQLADCQNTVNEIEKKVLALLEGKDQEDLMREAESLSLKLRSLKLRLERMQEMLQMKPSNEQVPNGVTASPDSAGHLQAAHNGVTDPARADESITFGTELVEKKLGDPAESEPTHETPVSQQSRLGNEFAEDVSGDVSPPVDAARPSSEDMSWCKWQYLQRELSCRVKPINDPIAVKDVTISSLPRFPVSAAKIPSSEDAVKLKLKLEVLDDDVSDPEREGDQRTALFAWLSSASRWLESVEEALGADVLSEEDAASHLSLCGKLKADIEKLSKAMESKKDGVLKPWVCGEDPAAVLSRCYANVQTLLTQTSLAADSKAKRIQTELQRSRSYQNDLLQLYEVLLKKKADLIQCFSNGGNREPTEELKDAAVYETELNKYESQVSSLKQLGENMSALNQDVPKLEEVLGDAWRVLRAKQVQCAGAAVGETRLGALSRGVSELLAVGKEKVSRSKTRRSFTKETLTSHLQDLKNFFSIFDNQVLLLQAHSLKPCHGVPGEEHTRYGNVLREASSLQEDAELHVIHLTSVLKDWQEFDSKYERLSKELKSLTSAIPSKSLVEETEERVKERFIQYQQIKKLIDANESRVSQIILDGKKILTHVSCRGLEDQITDAEQQWTFLTKKADHDLHRLETLIRLLTSYNRDLAELSQWLQSAQQKLKSWKSQSLDASQDLTDVQQNLSDFYEFTNDVDKKISLKSSVLSAADRLLCVMEADATPLKLRLAKEEDRWSELVAALPAVEERLQQLLTEKLPSWDAIKELMTWMSQEGRESDVRINPPDSASEIRDLLQEYKDLRKKTQDRQWVVDFVNQSLLQVSVGDVESKRYQRTEFAEHLGAMNLRWDQMKGNIKKKIHFLEQTLEAVSEDESRRQALSDWFTAQRQRLTKSRLLSSLTAAESLLADCEALEEQLVSKTDSIKNLRKSAAGAGADGGVLVLLDQKDSLAAQVAELKSSLPSVIQLWRTYEKNLEEVDRMTIRVSYVLEQGRRPAASLFALQSRVKSLRFVEEKAEQQEENWRNLTASLDRLNALCSPSVQEIMEERHRDCSARWAAANRDLVLQIETAESLLRPWEAYSGALAAHSTRLGELEEKWELVLNANISEDRPADSLEQRIRDLSELKQRLRELQKNTEHISELADEVIKRNSVAADMTLAEKEDASRRTNHLEGKVSSKAAELTLMKSDVDAFKGDLEALQTRVGASAEAVDQIARSGKETEEKSDLIKQHLLGVSEMSADIERLNEESFALPLDDHCLREVQNLNRAWSKTAAAALEHCREQRMIQLENNNFVQNYENWMESLEKMENCLTYGIAGTYETLKTQHEAYERLLAEIAINEHILPSFISKASSLLEKGLEKNRNEFILKLTVLREKWTSVIRLVREREKEVRALLKQWRNFDRSKRRTEKLLLGVQDALASLEKCHSYFQTEKLKYDFKDKERLLNRWRSVFLKTLDAGKDLQAIAEPETSATLSRDVGELQKEWETTESRLHAALTQLNTAVQKRNDFESRIEGRRKVLHELKARVDEPLPILHEELLKLRDPTKELEEGLNEWNESLRELDNMKTELSQYIITEDGLLLHKQVEVLHRQWDELCLRVSMRRQEIEDRLNAWNLFNEKNKELCDWLTQMETKALQTADLNTEEMIEKLQKDCMEEINLFSKNKHHLKQIGDQLIIASSKARAAAIDNKLHKINDRWQHLFDIIGSRVKRLKETLATIQQLEKNMSNLRTWLARIESELSKPVTYSICDDQEIQRKLAEQQDLQKDIELHSAGVASVLNICERLLHDTDGCASETQCDSIQQTTRSLDKRWRNVCTMSMERRLRIEETWRLWQKFLDDYSRFEEWLEESEAMAAFPGSSEVLYTKAKEELKKFEAFQRQIHERLTHLELINKQYRRLARENRTDAASKLKQMVHEGNLRWDRLQRRVSAVLRRLKHFTSQREEFEGTRDNILVWLTEIDLQLTNVEHFSESDIGDKMQRLTEFRQEILLNTNKVDQLIVFGEQLIQKSEAMDAVVIEDELEELHKYFQEVFGRVSRFHQRLTNRDLQLEEERETSENDTDAEDSRELHNTSWHSSIHEADTSHPSLCHLMPPPLPHERSGRETPVSVDSIPLEWDPTVDVGGSSMHDNEEDGTYYNALSDVEIPENPEAYVIMTTKTVQASSGKSDLDAASWHSADKAAQVRKREFQPRELMEGLIAATAETSPRFDVTSSEQAMTATDPGEPEPPASSAAGDQGIVGFGSPETHSGVIERWEIIQAQGLSHELSEKPNRQKLQQISSDINNVSLWLGQTERDLDNARKLKPAATVRELELKAKTLKDTLKLFDYYKAVVISANLSSKEFQPGEDAESRDLLNRLREVNLRWGRACNMRDEWKETLQNELIECQDFQDASDRLLIWITEADSRRLKYRVPKYSSERRVLLESQGQLTQLEEQVLERRAEVSALKDLCGCLLAKPAGNVYIEAEEKVHVLGSRLNQLIKDLSEDLKSVQRALDKSTSSDAVDSVGPVSSDDQAAVGRPAQDTDRSPDPAASARDVSRNPSLFYRVLRAAFPLQLLLLLLLLLACMIPYSEVDFSCAHSNNFARSFYPMLRYTNGPPPT